MSWLGKLKISTWNNWKLSSKQPVLLYYEILVPIIVLSVFIYIKSKTENSIWHQQTFTTMYLKDDSMSLLPDPNIIMAYSPNNNTFVKALMERNYYGIEGKRNSTELEIFLRETNKNISHDSKIKFCLGVQFEDDLSSDPKQFRINLRYGEFSFDGYWKRESVYPMDSSFRYVTYGADSGGLPHYHYYSLFDIMMYSLTSNILKMKTGLDLPNIGVRRFSEPYVVQDRFLEKMCQSFGYGLMIALAFSYSFLNNVRSLTSDEEKRIKKELDLIGASSNLYWFSHFLKIFLPLSLVALLYSIGFKIRWTNGSFFQYTDWFILLIFMMVFILGMITFGFTIGIFLSKSKRVVSISALIWIISLVPYVVIKSTNYDAVSASAKYLSSLNILSALSFGFDTVAIYEIRRRGVQWENIFETTRANNISFGGILLMMVFDIFFHVLIAFLMERASKCLFSDKDEGSTQGEEDLKLPTVNASTENGLSSLKNQIQAIILEKWILMRRFGPRKMLIVTVILFFMVASLKISDTLVFDVKFRNFSLEDYNEPVTLVENSTNNTNYLRLLEKLNQKYDIVNDMNATIIQLTEKDWEEMKYNYIVGASFGDTKGYTAWFNSAPYHAIPLTVQLMLKTHLMQLESGIDIDFVNFPVPQSSKQDSIKYAVTCNIIGLGSFFVVVFIGHSFLSLILEGRTAGLKSSGSNVFVYWITSFVMDSLSYLFLMLLIKIIFVVVVPGEISTAENLRFLSFILFNFGLSLIPFTYFCSYFLKNPSYLFTTCISCIAVLAFFIVRLLFLSKSDHASLVQKIFLVLPYYAFLELLYSMFISEDQFHSGLSRNVSCVSYLAIIIQFMVIFCIDSKVYEKISPRWKSLNDENDSELSGRGRSTEDGNERQRAFMTS